MYPPVAFSVTATTTTKPGLQRAEDRIGPFPPDLVTINPAFTLAASADAFEGNEFLEINERDFHRLIDQAAVDYAVTPSRH